MQIHPQVQFSSLYNISTSIFKISSKRPNKLMRYGNFIHYLWRMSRELRWVAIASKYFLNCQEIFCNLYNRYFERPRDPAREIQIVMGRCVLRVQ